jgi:hypothetical protein
VPPYQETYGDLAADVGEQLGMPMDPEQRMILDAIFAENEPGQPACFSVAAVAPRQNLKTATLEIAALTDLFVLGEPLHAWTAHLFDTARASFEHMCTLIESNDDFRKRCRKPMTANGNEAIQLLSVAGKGNGEKIEFHARSKGGGRGISGDKITWDEALFLQPAETGALLPILATRKGAQVRYGSSAGFVSSAVLRRIRDRGRAGGHARSAYFEWCAPLAECEDPGCDHELGVIGCVADRMDLLTEANPALGRRISIERLKDFREEMPPEEFIREFLGWWDEPGTADAAFGPGKWEACAGDPPPKGLPVGALGLAASMDLTHGAITAAANDGQVIHLKPLQHGPGTTWLIDRAKELQNQHDVDVIVDKRGPAAALIPHLERAGVRMVVVDTAGVLDACAGILDLVRERKIQHATYPELETAVGGAVRRLVGDRWAWGRKVSTADISTLEAATLAVQAVSLPPVVEDPPPAPVSLSSNQPMSTDSVMSTSF